MGTKKGSTGKATSSRTALKVGSTTKSQPIKVTTTSTRANKVAKTKLVKTSRVKPTKQVDLTKDSTITHGSMTYDLTTKDPYKYGFLLSRKKIKRGPFEHEIVQLEIHDHVIRNHMRSITGMEVFYEEPASVNAQDLFMYLPTIETQSQRERRLVPVLAFLKSEFAKSITAINAMVAEGEISFSYLWYLFQKDKLAVAMMDGSTYVAGKVVTSQYESSFFGTFLKITVDVVDTDGKGFYTRRNVFKIPAFSGTKKLSELAVNILEPGSKLANTLLERGKKFAKFGIGAHYLYYGPKAEIIRRSWWGNQIFKADGRIMLDTQSFDRMDPEYDRYARRDDDGDDSGVSDLDDIQLISAWPYIKGFSFACKKWGEICVDHINEIQFNDSAFETLVLDPETKELIKALVTNSTGTFQDIISGKGGGTIFLLHGTPGVGKTLTAEAIAELLHRPLYSVSVGELGVTPDQLEETLRKILEMATIWNAVVLLDEADIFLERRTENDIVRNAMVGIFLRLLEYHQGVMFLTTNRVRNFDEAFHSRISIALHYGELDEKTRKEIWTNLLAAAGITGLKPNILAKYELNGRQIKSTIRLAQSLAKSEGVAVNAKHIERTVKITEQFRKDLNEKSSI